jgi:hypothetical protein
MWQRRMAVFLRGKDRITVNTTYVHPINFLALGSRDIFDTNNKAVDYLFRALCQSEFDWVHTEALACRIWEQLKDTHDGNAQVQARMYTTYRREYENFTHLPGESIDALLQRFTVVVNNMRANVVVLPYNDHDRVVNLLHSLDRTVRDGKVEAILESKKYDTLIVNELFSKLKLAELDHGVTAHQESSTDSHSLSLLGGKGAKSNANASSKMYFLSSLMSLPDEEFDVLGEDDQAVREVVRELGEHEEDHRRAFSAASQDTSSPTVRRRWRTRTATSTGRARTASTDRGVITSTRISTRTSDGRGRRTTASVRPE